MLDSARRQNTSRAGGRVRIQQQITSQFVICLVGPSQRILILDTTWRARAGTPENLWDSRFSLEIFLHVECCNVPPQKHQLGWSVGSVDLHALPVLRCARWRAFSTAPARAVDVLSRCPRKAQNSWGWNKKHSSCPVGTCRSLIAHDGHSLWMVTGLC